MPWDLLREFGNTQKYDGRSRTTSRDSFSAHRVLSRHLWRIIDEAATGPGVSKASKGIYYMSSLSNTQPNLSVIPSIRTTVNADQDDLDRWVSWVAVYSPLACVGMCLLALVHIGFMGR
jgi:hypothetical protein